MSKFKSFHNTNFTEKLVRDGVEMFERSLLTSPDSYSVYVKGIEIKALVSTTADDDRLRILFRKDEIEWGDIVLFEGKKWLIADQPYFNRIHSKSQMLLCNSELTFTTLTDGVYEYDRLGNKIWIEQPQEIITKFPCVIESVTGTKTATGQRINISEGDMTLLIQNTDSELIKIGNNFQLYGDKYRIAGIDESKTYDDKGMLILIASRIANENT